MAMTYRFFDFNNPKRYGPFLEEWMPVKSCEFYYEVSNYGRLKTLPRVLPETKSKRKNLNLHIRRLLPNKKTGYVNCKLCLDNRNLNSTVHRLMAIAFIPNPENLPEVNHKNGIKNDLFIGNFEWVTLSKNELHAHATGLKFAKQSLQVIDISTGIIFDSIKQAAFAFNINKCSLRLMLIGKYFNKTNLIFI